MRAPARALLPRAAPAVGPVLHPCPCLHSQQHEAAQCLSRTPQHSGQPSLSISCYQAIFLKLRCSLQGGGVWGLWCLAVHFQCSCLNFPCCSFAWPDGAPQSMCTLTPVPTQHPNVPAPASPASVPGSALLSCAVFQRQQYPEPGKQGPGAVSSSRSQHQCQRR